MKKPTNQRGFTLVELMIVLMIVAIMMAVAAPSFRDSIERNRREAAFTSFSSAILTTRSEAARSNQQGVLCVSSDAATCTGGSWGDGWILFVEDKTTGDKDYAEADDGPLLGVQEQLQDGYTLTATSGATTIAFSPTGEPDAQSRFIICSPDGEITEAKFLRMTAVGQLRTDKQQAGDACP